MIAGGEGDKNNSTDFFIAEVRASDLEMLVCLESHTAEWYRELCDALYQQGSNSLPAFQFMTSILSLWNQYEAVPFRVKQDRQFNKT